MEVNAQTILTAAGVVSAVGAGIGGILKIHSFTLEQKKLRADLEKQRRDFEVRISDLEKHHNEDMRRVNEENCLICFALSACLNGLQELGAKNVAEAKEKLDKFINQQAHV